jgi:hypothetical protein
VERIHQLVYLTLQRAHVRLGIPLLRREDALNWCFRLPNQAMNEPVREEIRFEFFDWLRDLQSTAKDTGTEKSLRVGGFSMFQIPAVRAAHKKRDNAFGATRRPPLGRVSIRSIGLSGPLVKGNAGIFSDQKEIRKGKMGQVAALNFRPVEQLVADADVRLHEIEGTAFEKLVGVLYEERSRKGVGDFPLTDRIRGYWDRGDTEIDLVAINEGAGVIRFGSCKRSATELVADLTVFDGHVERFLDQFPRCRSWRVEKVSLAPRIPEDVRREMTERGRQVQDVTDLIADLRPGWPSAGHPGRRRTGARSS